jgi:hypothetical protein
MDLSSNLFQSDPFMPEKAKDLFQRSQIDMSRAVYGPLTFSDWLSMIFKITKCIETAANYLNLSKMCFFAFVSCGPRGFISSNFDP